MITKTGDWNKLSMVGSHIAMDTAARAVIARQLLRLQRDIKEGITDGGPSGSKFDELSDLTIAARELKGFEGTKPLIRNRDLHNSIHVSQSGVHGFVGISRKEKSKDGKKLYNIGLIQEFGTKPYILRMTAKLRRFLFLLYAKAGFQKPSGNSGKSTAFIIVQIKPRPFVRPVFEGKSESVATAISDAIAGAVLL